MGPRPQRRSSFFLLPPVLFFASAASATITDHTIDDTDPSVTSANLGGLCRNCDFKQHSSRSINGSATSLNPPGSGEPESTMVISFTELDFGTKLSPAAQKLVESSRFTLNRLTLDAQSTVNENHVDTTPQPRFLADLPALTPLTLVSTNHQVADAETLLAGPPLQNSLPP
ncbi:hypothetical protein K438DRAFT_2027421 [Mycena galopus ATCC 62051]|nr:hypothetical protein K438DRAFT_2027421 [Mycena galopus ATCC 62051]